MSAHRDEHHADGAVLARPEHDAPPPTVRARSAGPAKVRPLNSQIFARALARARCSHIVLADVLSTPARKVWPSKVSGWALDDDLPLAWLPLIAERAPRVYAAILALLAELGRPSQTKPAANLADGALELGEKVGAVQTHVRRAIAPESPGGAAVVDCERRAIARSLDELSVASQRLGETARRGGGT